ncbi:hypothetical protein KFE98_20165 [bacterium SCSIO 12741]|nr:hypothetical protein KFE98_20165 [bacterium SCSIO 12741]
MNTIPRKDLIFLLLIGILATLINVNKAFHIDDTFYLEAAQWIEHNPLHPFSAVVNWENTARPIYVENNPHCIITG